MRAMIYMDANATTPVEAEVVRAMAPYWAEAFGNPSSVHQAGQRARAATEEAREQVAGLLGCRAAEVVWTSGGTEADNLALFGAVRPGEGLVVSAIEHDAVLRAAMALGERGAEVAVLPCTAQGVVEVEALRAVLTPRTRLVSVMLANNETGVVQPVRELAEVAHRAGALFHTDAVQAAGKMQINVRELGCDLLTVSGHKVYGPKGVGALYVRKGVTLRSVQHGGPQERGRRAGTENVAAVVGMGVAASLAQAWMEGGGVGRLGAMRDRLERGVCEGVAGVVVNGGGVVRVCNTTNLRFRGVVAEELMIALDLSGLAVSAGSACQSGAIEPSHVLLAMGLRDAEARESVRFSLLRGVTGAEVDRVVEVVCGAVGRMRGSIR